MFESAESASVVVATAGRAVGTADPHIAVWLDEGVPVRLVWRGIRYRVSDEPTVLTDRIEHPLMTHPLERRIGWRFQATDARGSALVFDVRRDGEEWILLRVWD